MFELLVLVQRPGLLEIDMATLAHTLGQLYTNSETMLRLMYHCHMILQCFLREESYITTTVEMVHGL